MKSSSLGSKIGTTLTPALNVGGSGDWMQNHAWVERGSRLKAVAGGNLGKARSELLGNPHAKGDGACRNPRQRGSQLCRGRLLRDDTPVEARQRQSRREREDRSGLVRLPLCDMLGQLSEGGDEALIRGPDKIVVCLHLTQRG